MNPEGYVEIQHRVNGAHLNGRLEAEHEEAIEHARTLAKWIKWHELPADSFLDSGCRTGYGLEELGVLFPAARVVGLDIVPVFVKHAELRGEAVLGDMQAMPFTDGEFDWTFSSTSIEHCPDIAAAAAEMRRVSRVGFYVQTDIETDEAFQRNPSHFTQRSTPDEWLHTFEAPGWWPVHLCVPRKERIELIYIRSTFAHLLKDPLKC